MTRSLQRKDIGVTLSALTVSLWFGISANQVLAAEANTVPEWPSAPGAVLAFGNTHFATTKIAFDSKGRNLMVFNCDPRGRGLFGRFHDLVCGGGSFQVRDAGEWIGLQVAKSGAFTIEVTITPAEAAPKSRGVILAYGNDAGEDVALMQDNTGLSLRLGGGQPIALFTPEARKPVHVLVTCDAKTWAAYRDGVSVCSGKLAAAVAAWGTRQFVLGAAWSGADPWLGRMEGIAVFPRALTAKEAAGEAAAMKALQADRKPATSIRFRGTLVRQAKTSALEQIRPYTRSMTVAEYKVDQVLAGEWKQPTIMVLHWMIMESKRLPLADRKPGTTVELKVEPLAEHPQLESCRRDDEMDGALGADLFYCESETEP